MEARRSKPAEVLRPQIFTITVMNLLANDHRIKLADIEGAEQAVRVFQTDFDGQGRITFAQLGQQGRDFRPCDVFGDAQAGGIVGIRRKVLSSHGHAQQ